MAWQKHLEAIDKKQAVQGDRLERIEQKLDKLLDLTPDMEPVEITAEELEEIDGVGPATAQRILELLEK